VIKNSGHTGIGAEQSGGHRQRGRLAGTVRPDEGEHASSSYLQIEMINGQLGAERLA
jgi:hypothetical protein